MFVEDFGFLLIEDEIIEVTKETLSYIIVDLFLRFNIIILNHCSGSISANLIRFNACFFLMLLVLYFLK